MVGPAGNTEGDGDAHCCSLTCTGGGLNMRESVVVEGKQCTGGGNHHHHGELTSSDSNIKRNGSVGIGCQNNRSSEERLSDDLGGITATPWDKLMKVYRNGQERCSSVPVLIDRQVVGDWSKVLQVLQEAIKVPVQQVFTTSGKKLSSISDLDKVHELVVSGEEPYKMLPYGHEVGNEKLSLSSPLEKKKNVSQITKPKLRRTERESLARSVILEASSLGGDGDSMLQLSNTPLAKTYSEQDVSSIQNKGLCSPKLRIRQSHSPRPRPMSAYQGSMTTSIERSPIGMSVSRIPKRIISSPSTNVSNQASSPLSTSRSSKKIVEKVISAERPSRQGTLYALFVCLRNGRMLNFYLY
jgi:hypothetical protein